MLALLKHKFSFENHTSNVKQISLEAECSQYILAAVISSAFSL